MLDKIFVSVGIFGISIFGINQLLDLFKQRMSDNVLEKLRLKKELKDKEVEAERLKMDIAQYRRSYEGKIENYETRLNKTALDFIYIAVYAEDYARDKEYTPEERLRDIEEYLTEAEFNVKDYRNLVSKWNKPDEQSEDRIYRLDNLFTERLYPNRFRIAHHHSDDVVESLSDISCINTLHRIITPREGRDIHTIIETYRDSTDLRAVFSKWEHPKPQIVGTRDMNCHRIIEVGLSDGNILNHVAQLTDTLRGSEYTHLLDKNENNFIIQTNLTIHEVWERLCDVVEGKLVAYDITPEKTEEEEEEEEEGKWNKPEEIFKILNKDVAFYTDLTSALENGEYFKVLDRDEDGTRLRTSLTIEEVYERISSFTEETPVIVKEESNTINNQKIN